MRGVFAVEEPEGQRWEFALDLLRSGEAFSLGQLVVRRRGCKVIAVDVESDWGFDALSEKYIHETLVRAREGIEELIVSDPAFAAAGGKSKFEYAFVWDAGMAVHEVCRLIGDDLEWSIPLPR